MTRFVAFVVILVVAPMSFAVGGEEEQGEGILKRAGVQGGLCLYVGDDVVEIGNIARTGRFLVHVLAPSKEIGERLRKHFADVGLTEFLSVEAWSGNTLPYEKNHVTLIAAADFPALVAEGLSVAEVVRVLNPLGVACLGGIPADEHAKLEATLENAGIPHVRWEPERDPWLVFQKPYPKKMGTWTHPYHGADGNPVADDTYMGFPNQLQWITSRRDFSQYGDFNCMLVGGGRSFTFYAKILVARDAGSGVALWTMPLPKVVGGRATMVESDLAMPDVNSTIWGGEQMLVSGATGEVIRRFGKASYAPSYMDGVLIYGINGYLHAYDPATGDLLWSHEKDVTYRPRGFQFPKTSGPYRMHGMVRAHGRVYFRNEAGELVVVDNKTGELIFRKDLRAALGSDFGIHFAFGDKVLLHSEIKEEHLYTYSSVMVAPTEVWKGVMRLTAISGKDGSIAWTHDLSTLLVPHYKGQVFKAANRIWLSRWGAPLPEPDNPPVKTRDRNFAKFTQDPQPGVWDGLDLETGEVRNTFTAPDQITYHCYRLNATDRYLTGNRPYYFVDWKTGKLEGRFGAMRPGCSAQGLFAAQGLFFANGGTGCGCMRTVMSGFAAFSADGSTWDGAVSQEEHPVETGPEQAPNVAEKQESVKIMRDKMIGKTSMILSPIILSFRGF